MKLVLIAVLLCALACSARAQCLVPSAVPNDGLDDRVAIQAALDTAATIATVAKPVCVQLSPGRYDVTRKSEIGVKNIASLRLTGAVELRGAGERQTTLAMLGSGKLAGALAPTDWILLSVTGEGGAVRELTLDGSARTETGEQTHLLQVEGPSKKTTIEHVMTVLPYHGPSSGGDCIRLLGSVDALVQGTTIRRSTGLNCDRSWLGVQRGVKYLTVEDSSTWVVGDQAIDFEPTGSKAFACAPIVDEVTFTRLVLRRGAGALGPTMSVTGEGCSLTRAVKITDVTLYDGYLFVHLVDRLTIKGLVLR